MSDLSEALRLFITNSGRRARLDVSGELDVTTVGAFRDHLDLLVESATGDVDVDLALVTFCDATALAVIVAAHQQLAPVGRHLRIINASPSVVRLLQLTALDALLLPTEAAERSLDGTRPDRQATPTPYDAAPGTRKQSRRCRSTSR